MHVRKFKGVFLEILTDAKIKLVALIYSLTQKSAKMEIDGLPISLLQMPTLELGLRNFKKRWVRI